MNFCVEKFKRENETLGIWMWRVRAIRCSFNCQFQVDCQLSIFANNNSNNNSKKILAGIWQESTQEFGNWILFCCVSVAFDFSWNLRNRSHLIGRRMAAWRVTWRNSISWLSRSSLLLLTTPVMRSLIGRARENQRQMDSFAYIGLRRPKPLMQYGLGRKRVA